MNNKEIKIFFISGHRDITEEEFKINYVPAINDALFNYNSRFIIGDYHGVDIMAQDYLIDVMKIDPKFVTVCHMFDKPRNINEKIINIIGGFKTDEERDSYMTINSDEDIAFIRDRSKYRSGTAQNILRRNLFKQIK